MKHRAISRVTVITLLAGIIMLSCVSVVAEETTEAYTVYGRGVILHENGKWEYADFNGVYEVDRHEIEHPDGIPIERLLPCLVYEVIDGDTIKVRFDHPPQGFLSEEPIRLLGVQARELDEGDPFAEKAQSYVDHAVLGKRVYLAFEREWRGNYGRLLGYVFLENGEMINAELIRRGLAKVYRSSVCHFQNLFLEYESEARSEGRGLWEEHTNAPVFVLSVFNDGYEEYVIVVNNTGKPIDISGWTLEDEARHVLVVPDGTIIDAGSSICLLSGRSTEASCDAGVKLSEDTIWNNSGDIVRLYDTDGKLVYEYEY